MNTDDTPAEVEPGRRLYRALWWIVLGSAWVIGGYALFGPERYVWVLGAGATSAVLAQPPVRELLLMSLKSMASLSAPKLVSIAIIAALIGASFTLVADDTLRWTCLGIGMGALYLAVSYIPVLGLGSLRYPAHVALLTALPLALMVPCANLLVAAGGELSWFAGYMVIFGGVGLIKGLLELTRAHGSASFRRPGTPSWEAQLLEGLGFTTVGVGSAFSPAILLLGGVLIVVGFHVRFLATRLGEAALREAMLERLAHDLRTPAAAVRSLAETIAHGDLEDAAEQRRFAALMVKESERLVTGLERSLAVARGGQQPALERVRLDLSEWAASLAERWQTLIPELRLEAPGPTPVEADPERLDEAVDALVDNALRHGRSPIELTVTSSDTHVSIAVSDAGDGVPDAGRAAVVKKLTGVIDRYDAEAPGGLGTWVAGAVAKAHGGELQLEGQNRFVLSLPQAGSATPKPDDVA